MRAFDLLRAMDQKAHLVSSLCSHVDGNIGCVRTWERIYVLESSIKENKAVAEADSRATLREMARIANQLEEAIRVARGIRK